MINIKASFTQRQLFTGLFFLHLPLLYFIYHAVQFSPGLPATLSRFTISPVWRSLAEDPQHLPPSLTNSTNRAFVSSLPILSTDGLGHRFSIINYELTLALLLNVTYIHRIAKYGSLSPDHNPLAVERLFGWTMHPYSRDAIFRSACDNIERVHAPLCGNSVNEKKKSHGHYLLCTKLRSNGPFKHLVYIPSHLGDCLRFPRTTRKKCKEDLRNFSRKHPHSHTLFQLTPNHCSGEYRSGDFSMTGKWFRDHYWGFHRHSTSNKETPGVTRILRLDSGRVEVSVHVRRGDLFHYADRQIIPDSIYADLDAKVARAARNALGNMTRVGVTIYSEGVAIKGKMKANHDVSRMKKIYLDANGNMHGDGRKYWKSMLVQRGLSWVELETDIAGDTVRTIHEMCCSDVFVGSASGLSLQLVGVLGRGVMIMPGKIRGKTRHGLNFKYSYEGDTSELDEGLVEGIEKVAGELTSRARLFV